MAKQYNITIQNGTGTANVLNGNYTVESNTTGYQNTSIDPNTANIVEGTNTYEFTISAEGTLTLHVTETGVVDGTPIVGAKFIRCDKDGNTYGTEIETNSTGNAIFANVPFDASAAPKIYYKQTASDDSHTFDGSLKEITLETNTKTVEVANPLPQARTFTLKDKNYSGLLIESGEIILKN